MRFHALILGFAIVAGCRPCHAADTALFGEIPETAVVLTPSGSSNLVASAVASWSTTGSVANASRAVVVTGTQSNLIYGALQAESDTLATVTARDDRAERIRLLVEPGSIDSNTLVVAGAGTAEANGEYALHSSTPSLSIYRLASQRYEVQVDMGSGGAAIYRLFSPYGAMYYRDYWASSWQRLAGAAPPPSSVGYLSIPASYTNAATVLQISEAVESRLPLSGGTMSGPLTLAPAGVAFQGIGIASNYVVRAVYDGTNVSFNVYAESRP